MKADRKCRARQSSPTKARPLSTRAFFNAAQVSSGATGAMASSEHSINSRCASLCIPSVSDPACRPKFGPYLSISNRELTMRRASASRAQRGICSAADFAKGTSAPSGVTRPACRQRGICSAADFANGASAPVGVTRPACRQAGICSALSNRELTMRRASASRAQRGICSAVDFAKGTSAPSGVTRPACRQRGICSALSNRELLGLEYAATH
jgi:hypothetical protein